MFFWSGFCINLQKHRWMKGTYAIHKPVILQLSRQRSHRYRGTFSLTGTDFPRFFGEQQKTEPGISVLCHPFTIGEGVLKLHLGEEQHWNLNMPEWRNV